MPPLEQLVLLFGLLMPITACLGRARLWAILVISVLSGIVLYMIHPVDLDGYNAGELTPEIINVIDKPYSKQIYVIGVCNSALSQTRVTNLQSQLLEWDFGMWLVCGPLPPADIAARQRKQLSLNSSFVRALLHYKSTFVDTDDATYKDGVLVVDDDTEFHPNMPFVLEASMRDLDAWEPDWQWLHLCAGGLWGRHQSHPKDFLLRPKGRPGLITEGKVDLKQLPFLFGSWPKIDGNPVLPGGPDALYVKTHVIAKLVDTVLFYIVSHIDIMLMSLAQNSNEWKVFVAREPQMCVENEQGSTVLSV